MLRVYELFSSNIVSELFDDEYVLLNLQSGRYFSFTKSASAIIQQLLEGVAVDEILVGCENNSIYKPDAIQEFIRKLIELEVLKLKETSASSQLSGDFSNTMEGLSDKLEVEVFDDLADLIIADPIHEVEEDLGWPNRKNND